MLYARYMYPDSGFPYHREAVQSMNLKLGKRYLVEDVDMGQSYTGIKLDGFDRYVNSVFFDFEDDNFNPIDIYSDPKYNHYIQRQR